MRSLFYKKFIFKLFLNLALFGPSYSQIHSWGNWKKWGDQGNNRFVNPILPSDYSDIDCIRVKSDYYAVSSTFQYSPGFIILHSKDLVNWSILNHAVQDLTKISPELNWNKMNRYGKGIWAGAIRYHNKKFWIYFGTPDEGYFMTTAKYPSGPWSSICPVLAEKGWDDCCPFWDDDGQAYLIGTNFLDNYNIHLFKLSADGKNLIGKYDKIIHYSNGSEANKLYKIHGIYYHLFSEVGPGGRTLMMERSKNIEGPYKEIRQLSAPQKQFNEPNQGGLVQTKDGKWYFLTHHGKGDWSGRIMSLLPVSWLHGWPIIGKIGSDTTGHMVWSGTKPVRTNTTIHPKTNDEFNEPFLSQQWEWNYQPRADKWSLTERKGWLRLYAFKPIDSNNFFKAGNTLTQRSFRTMVNQVIIRIDIAGMADGQKTGLGHYGYPYYSALGVVCIKTAKFLQFDINGKSIKGGVLKRNFLWLKSMWGLGGKCQYSYSLDGKSYLPFGSLYQMVWGGYRGDRIAIFNYNNIQNLGYVDVAYFHYTFGNDKDK